MSAIQDVPSQAAYNRLFDVLTDDTRRRIIRILRQRAGPLSEELLADRLADETAVDAEADAESDGDDATTAERLRVQLRHLHLPKLDASGLVSWDEKRGTVAEANHPSIEIGSLDAVVAVDDDRGSIAAALADERRRTVLEVATDADGDMDRETIARAVAERDADEQPSESQVRQVATQLHHRHLPQLEEAGLLDYDADAATVTYEGPDAVSSLLPVIE